MTETRPNPDALLTEVQQQEARQQRGRLKVFFGMAAGVGKTYAMLEEARARAAEGLDVVVGYAEPHIRTDTEALLLGMELIPYKLVEYRGATLKASAGPQHPETALPWQAGLAPRAPSSRRQQDPLAPRGQAFW